ncbi:MAG: hypothetical protein KGH69_04315 [Candidatus Micrarchaeota archaeon]|nr:hypothetical protein [Candidatus Micrarchaeota archaeon]
MATKQVPGRLIAVDMEHMFGTSTGASVTREGDSRIRGSEMLREIVRENPDVRVFMVQDCHPSARIKRFVVKGIEAVKEEGITHYCIELPANYGQRYDNLIQGLERPGEIREIIADFYKCMGAPQLVYDAHVLELMHMGSVPKMVGIEHPDSGTRNAPTADDRERHMFSGIREILEESPGNRVVALLGGSHAKDGNLLATFRDNPSLDWKVPSVTSRLIASGIDVVTISFPETRAEGLTQQELFDMIRK